AKDTVQVRPPDLIVDENDTVWPGLHQFESPDRKDNGYGVVWWDPRALTLGVPQSFGIRQEELLKESDDPEIAKKTLNDYQRWKSHWNDIKDEAAKPGVVFRTATAHARIGSMCDAHAQQVRVIELPRDPGRPAGARFGTLVHATLAAVPL